MTTNHALELLASDGSFNKEPVGAQEPSVKKAARETIKIVGVGGGGNNALDHIIRCGITDVEFLGVNTDVRCLEHCLAPEKLVLGEKLTGGLGAGAMPEIGMQAALESRDQIRSSLKGCDMVYLAAGMGGGTGTGAMPVIAQIAKEMGLLTVAVVTKPFTFEGRKRKRFADEGIANLSRIVDALLVVPNDKLLELSDRTTSLSEAFAMADNILRQAVKGVTDLITRAGTINVDFADLRNIMKHAGHAVMGIGVGTGENRLNSALKRAMESPLMESPMNGAKGVLFNITSGPDMGIMEVQTAADFLASHIDPDANYVWGWVQDESIGDSVQVVVIATGFDRVSTDTEQPKKEAKPSARFTESFDPSDARVGTVPEAGDEFDYPSIFRRRPSY